jgi:DnaK suppressor protein
MTEKLNVEEYKKKLLAEKARLEAGLAEVGRKNPDNAADWEATEGENADEPIADVNDLADAMEEFETRSATVATFEDALKDVVDALEKIEKGTYGVCEVSGEPIEKERLDANPAARTCKAHLNA